MTEWIENTRRTAVAHLLRALCVLLGAVAMSHGAFAATGKSNRSANADNGAIAFHPPSGSFGYAVDQRSAREAKVAALRQCGDADCEVVLTLKNSCGALANNRRVYFASRGATREEAEVKARRQCGPKCEILVWACTK